MNKEDDVRIGGCGVIIQAVVMVAIVLLLFVGAVRVVQHFLWLYGFL